MRRAYLFLIAFAGLAGAIATAATAPPPTLSPAAEQATRIVVEKAERQMTVYRNDEAVGVYDIALGFAPEGDKFREGDGRTPEGLYHIDRRNAESAYHLSLGLNYPTLAERGEAAAVGRDPGGDIFIHGQPNALPKGMMVPGDWTAGCIAVTNREIEAIWAMVPVGTPVLILP